MLIRDRPVWVDLISKRKKKWPKKDRMFTGKSSLFLSDEVRRIKNIRFSTVNTKIYHL